MDGTPRIASDFDLVEADHAYEIDTWGANAEVYEITPRSNPNYTCMVFIQDFTIVWVIGISGDLSVSCFPKPIIDVNNEKK